MKLQLVAGEYTRKNVRSTFYIHYLYNTLFIYITVVYTVCQIHPPYKQPYFFEFSNIYRHVDLSRLKIYCVFYMMAECNRLDSHDSPASSSADENCDVEEGKDVSPRLLEEEADEEASAESVLSRVAEAEM